MSTNYYLVKDTDVGILKIIHLGKYSSFNDGTFASNFNLESLERIVNDLIESPQDFRIVDEYNRHIKLQEFYALINTAPHYEIQPRVFS